MPDPEPSPLEDFICFAVYSAGHAFNLVYRPLLADLNLTYPQYLVMTALWAQDDRTVGDLGAELGLGSSTLTPLLKRLETLGHVERRRSTVDERQVCVRLTATGTTLREQAAHIPGCIAAATGLSEERLGQLCADVVSLGESLRWLAAQGEQSAPVSPG